mmetsp:Transcript_10814/g.30979  ORF Transcript_10814/g.30979 Transcript_10814/m.30979 type:complete len:252 (-) Transcript_10814:827-1582(-)
MINLLQLHDDPLHDHLAQEVVGAIAQVLMGMEALHELAGDLLVLLVSIAASGCSLGDLLEDQTARELAEDGRDLLPRFLLRIGTIVDFLDHEALHQLREDGMDPGLLFLAGAVLLGHLADQEPLDELLDDGVALGVLLRHGADVVLKLVEEAAQTGMVMSGIADRVVGTALCRLFHRRPDRGALLEMLVAADGADGADAIAAAVGGHAAPSLGSTPFSDATACGHALGRDGAGCIAAADDLVAACGARRHV